MCRSPPGVNGLSLQNSGELSPLAFHSATLCAQISSLAMPGSMPPAAHLCQTGSVQRIRNLGSGPYLAF